MVSETDLLAYVVLTPWSSFLLDKLIVCHQVKSFLILRNPNVHFLKYYCALGCYGVGLKSTFQNSLLPPVFYVREFLYAESGITTLRTINLTYMSVFRAAYECALVSLLIPAQKPSLHLR